MADTASSYSTDDLYSALAAADKAGDTAGAAQIAQMIQAQGTGPGASGTAANTAPSSGTMAPAGAPSILSPVRQQLRLGSKVLEGVGDLVDIPRTVESLADRGLTAGANWLTGNNLPSPDSVKTSLPGLGPVNLGVPSAVSALNALGVTNNPALAPQGLAERLSGDVAQGLPMAAPIIASGGTLGPALATTGTASLASGEAHELAPNSILAPIVAGMFGGYGVGSIDRMLTANANVKTAKAAYDAAEAELESFKDSLPQNRFDLGQQYSKAKTLLGNTYDSFVAAAKAERDALHQGFDKTIEAVASRLAPSVTVEDAGNQLQPAARNWLGTVMPQKMAALWKPLDDGMPAEATGDISPIVSAAKKLSKNAGSLQGPADAVQSSGVKTLAQRLSDSVENLENPEAPLTQKPWSDIAAFRSTLGEAMGDQKVVNDMGRQNLANLYAVTTGVMKRVAGANGLGDAFDKANVGSKALFDTAEGTMSKIVSGKNPDPSLDPLPGAAAKSLLATGARDSADLATVRAELPEAADHLAAAALRSGQWSKLGDSAKQALLPDPDARSALELAASGKTAANDALGKAVADADVTHQKNLDIAKLAQQEGNLLLTQSTRSLSKAKAAAQDNVKALTADRGSAVVHGLSGLTGLGLGGELGVAGLNALGLPGSDIVHGAIGSIVGLTAPALARAVTSGVKNAVKNPRSLRYPAVGAAVGASQAPVNALTGQ